MAWAMLPVTLVLYVVFRLMPWWPALLVSQIIFVVPVLLSSLAAYRAFSVGQPGVERQAWGLTALAMLVLFFSETYYACYELFVSVSGPPSPSIFDVLNALALLLVCVAAVWLGGVMTMGGMKISRLAFDVLAFSITTFAALYHHLAEPLSGLGPWWMPASWSTYSLAGILILIGIVWLIANATTKVEKRLTMLIGAGFGIYAIGMVLSPFSKASSPTQGSETTWAFVSAVYLLGYYLVMMAGITRLHEKEGPWRVSHIRQPNNEGVWGSTLISLWVLLGIGMIGLWLYEPHRLSADTIVYTVCAVGATLALVARTAVSGVETAFAKNTADLDTVTCAFNGASFLRRCDEALRAIERTEGHLSAIVFDVDDFSAVNDALGHAGGDEILAQIAETTTEVAGTRGEVFRVSADEFAVLGEMTEGEASGLAAEILEALRELRPFGARGLSASIGVACCAGGCERDELLRQANAAQAWAKYHGKDRVVNFDSRIVRALGVEERLRAQQDSNGLDMARALASAADARDVRNYYHSRNVAALAVMLSEAIGLEPERVRRIEIAAMLHDCGKIALDDALLAEVLRTSRQQLAAREHATLGESLVRSVGMPDVADWVRHHHERWDGAGYPDGLSGESVPLESRIISLADAYDAMTSGIRTHSPMSAGAALQEIDLGMGSRFDPMLAETFIQVVGATASLGWSDKWVAY
jgi:diguanylate cyclase (GGDEF)-like protein